MTIFVTWHLRVTLNSICNSYDVYTFSSILSKRTCRDVKSTCIPHTYICWRVKVSPHVYRRAKKIIIHKRYKPEEFELRSYNDIALIQFDKPLKVFNFPHLRVKLQPICLPPNKNFKDYGRQGGVLFWDNTSLTIFSFCSGIWIWETKRMQNKWSWSRYPPRVCKQNYLCIPW